MYLQSLMEASIKIVNKTRQTIQHINKLKNIYCHSQFIIYRNSWFLWLYGCHCWILESRKGLGILSQSCGLLLRKTSGTLFRSNKIRLIYWICLHCKITSFHANILTWFYDRTSSLDSSFLLSKINKKESCRLRMQMIKQQDVRKEKNISSVKLFFLIFFFVRGLYVFAQFAFIRGVKMKVVETVKTKWHDAKATLKKEGLLLVKWMNNTKLVCQKPVKSSSESCSVSELSISANSRIEFRF